MIKVIKSYDYCDVLEEAKPKIKLDLSCKKINAEAIEAIVSFLTGLIHAQYTEQINSN